jgi:uncharacterized protein (DUF4415 family)
MTDMAEKRPPVVFDDDNPEWTEEDFARARPIADFPELAAAFPNAKPRGRPVGSLTSNKVQIALRADRDVVERFKADGPGWQTRMNDALRKAAGL